MLLFEIFPPLRQPIQINDPWMKIIIISIVDEEPECEKCGGSPAEAKCCEINRQTEGRYLISADEMVEERSERGRAPSPDFPSKAATHWWDLIDIFCILRGDRKKARRIMAAQITRSRNSPPAFFVCALIKAESFLRYSHG